VKDGSIYIYDDPPRMSAKFLLTYSEKFGEIWSTVPSGEARRRRLSEIVSSCAAPGVNPVSLLEYYDCAGQAEDLTKMGAPRPAHQICCVCGGLNGANGKGWTGYMEVLTEVVRKMEAEFGRVWMFDMHDHSDAHYVYFGFNDKAVDFWKMWSSPDLCGNDCKFLCDCGQFRSRNAFVKACPWGLDPKGRPLRGMVFNDSSNRGRCSDWVFTGGAAKPFMNKGFVGNPMVDPDNGVGYSWVAAPRNIDESKCEFFDYSGKCRSIEEFVIRREAAGGLKPGDYFYLPDTCSYPLWDGEKWVDQQTERPIDVGRGC